MTYMSLMVCNCTFIEVGTSRGLDFLCDIDAGQWFVNVSIFGVGCSRWWGV